MTSVTKWAIGGMSATAKGANIIDNPLRAIGIADAAFPTENQRAIWHNIYTYCRV